MAAWRFNSDEKIQSELDEEIKTPSRLRLDIESNAGTYHHSALDFLRHRLAASERRIIAIRHLQRLRKKDDQEGVQNNPDSYDDNVS